MSRPRSTCWKSDCSYPVAGRGLCAYHYNKLRRILHTRGEFTSMLVPNSEALEHLSALRNAGVGLPRIAEVTGIPFATLCHLDHPGRRSILRSTADKLLALDVPTSPLDPLYSDGSKVPIIGSTRRLRALTAVGYSRNYLTRRLGLDPANLPLNKVFEGRGRTSQPTVTAARARAIDALYRELAATPGPDARARRLAAKRGWHPPSNWVEGTIDDPNAPGIAAMGRRPKRVPTAEFADYYLDARDHAGMSDERIADLMGIDYESLIQRLRRADIPSQRALSDERRAS